MLLVKMQAREDVTCGHRIPKSAIGRVASYYRRGRPNLDKRVQLNERAAALAALSEDQRKHLAAYARIMSRGTGQEGDDLLQEAFARWLGSDKAIQGLEQTFNFLRGAINSIRYNAFRHERVVLQYHGVRAVAQEDDEDDPLEQAADPAASTDTPLLIQQLYDLFAGDEEIQLLLMRQAENAAPDEIQAELDWDEKKYKAVQKRKIRLVARLMLEGKLK
jgi:DNA-directed RNA polymerase specialized sigma24 family protein